MLLYHNKHELFRVVERVDITEEGMFVHDEVPDDYGGAVLTLEIVHRVAFADSAGYVEILHLDNPTPLDKQKNASAAAIVIDGEQFRAGTSPARNWTKTHSAHLPADYKTKADITIGIMAGDGPAGTPI